MKLCVDRITASQLKNSNNDPNIVRNATVTNYKIYAACDLAMGLVMSKTQNFLLKEFPVQPSLPGKYYSRKFSKLYLSYCQNSTIFLTLL